MSLVRKIILGLLGIFLAISAIAQSDCIPDAGLGLGQVKDVLHTLNKNRLQKDFQDYGSPDVSATVLKSDEANKVFSQLALIQAIPFDYVEEGCYARAMAMSRVLDEEGITSARIFANAPYHFKVNWRLEYKRIADDLIRVDTKKSKKGYVEWVFHTAPVVYVDNGKTIVPMVFDPSLFDRPVTVEAWKGIMKTTHPNDLEIHFHKRFDYFQDRNFDDYNSKDYSPADLSDVAVQLQKCLSIQNKLKDAK
jgi:hypothetical protein